MKKQLINIFLVTLGSFIYSVAISSVIIPNNLGEGGVTGITVILYYLFSIPPSLTNLLINAGILILGWKLLDRLTIYYTILSVVLLSFFLRYVNLGQFMPGNSFVSAMLTGILIGVGLGLVILGHGTTAGSDIVAMIFKKYFGIAVSSTILIFDVIVVGILFFIIGLENGLITLTAIFITSYILNYILEGLNPKKQLIIISNHNSEIAKAIQDIIGRGITVFHGHGFYTRQDKEILYVVINRMQLVPTQRIINRIDPRAFVTVSSIQQVYGEGFSLSIEPKQD